MKLIILFLFCIINSAVYSQNVWLPTGEMSAGNTDFVYAMTGNRDGVLFASSWANGIYKSTNMGVNWFFTGLQGKRVSYLTVAPDGDIFALSKTVDFSYIHRSTDNGATWTDVQTQPFQLNYAGGGAMVFPVDGSIVCAYAVTVGPTIGDVAIFVFKSTNGGDSWFQTRQLNVGFVGGMQITADGKILMGTSTSGVVYSLDGVSFQSLNTFPAIFIETILKSEDNTIYVSDAFGLHRSTDNAISWTDVGTQNSTAYLRAGFVNSNTELFISTDDRKVFRSTNRGENWIQINEGIPTASFIYSFASVHSKVYTGLDNAGVYVFDQPTAINNNSGEADDFNLSQNFPNPFNPKTVIKFDVMRDARRETQDVKLIVYNSLGKEIMTLVNDRLLAGSYSVQWDAGNYPSGIYFYKLSVDNGKYTAVKQMTLVK